MFAGIVVGCGPSTKDAGPATPEQAAPKASASDDPRIARILSLLDDYANVLKTVAERTSKIVDDDSALAAGKELKKDAERVRGLSKKLKSVGKIAKQENPKLAASFVAVANSGIAITKANMEWLKKSASVKLSPEAEKALGEGTSEFNNAMLEFLQAMSEIHEPGAKTGRESN
jgi:hypothetical protein